MTVDRNGNPTGFYADDIHTSGVPVDAIEITDQEWRDMVADPGRYELNSGRVQEVAGWKAQDPTAGARRSALNQAADWESRRAFFAANGKPNAAARAARERDRHLANAGNEDS